MRARFFLYIIYCISGIFQVGLIFAEFATSLKSPKIDTPFYTSSLRVGLEIAKIGLGENFTVTFQASFLPKFLNVKNYRYTICVKSENFTLNDVHCIMITNSVMVAHMVTSQYRSLPMMLRREKFEWCLLTSLFWSQSLWWYVRWPPNTPVNWFLST